MLVPVTMHKAQKYAIDLRRLDEDTKTLLLRFFGCTRKVYNLYVDLLYKTLEEAGYEHGDNIPDVKLPEVSFFKKMEEYHYLKEADSLGLKNAKKHFEGALKRFKDDHDHSTHTKRAKRRAESGTEPLSFRGLKGMPKFRSKARGDFSYTTDCQHPGRSDLKNPTVRLEKDRLFLPKIKKGLPVTVHRPLPEDARIGQATVSMDTDGKIYASIEYSYTVMMDLSIRQAVLAGDNSVARGLSFIGLDYAQQDFYVDSEGRKANYPHYYLQSEERLAKLQRELSHMEKGSKNYERKKTEIAKLCKKVRNQRLDFVKKEASYLASRYDVVCVEDIDLRAMGQCLKLGKKLHDNGFGMFRDILARKLWEKGTCLVKVDRFYASSKLCSCCGYKKSDLTKNDREWTCPECGTHHDRDHNAGINIRREGMRIFPEYFKNLLAEDEEARKRSDNRKAAGRKKKAA